MSDNTCMAICVCVIVGSCSGLLYVDKKKPEPDAVLACVRAAWTNADRVECIKAGEKK